MSRAPQIIHSPSTVATAARLTLVVLVGILAFAPCARAADDLETLKDHFRKLQEENSGLKQKLDSQSDAINTLMHRLEALEKKEPAPAPAPDTAMETDPMAGDLADMEMGHGAVGKMPSLSLRWFGDVNYRAGGQVRDGEELPNTFNLGQLGVMASSQLSDRVSLMSEVVFQYRSDESASTTIERLQLQYQASDLFNFRVGRTHTPFGYWNETFHHGTWFQTTSLRPELMRFHDGGSVLPIHSVGVEMYGYQPTAVMDVHYNFGIGNGRGLTYTTTVDVQDLNDNKAIYGVLSLAPAGIPGLRFGVNGYGDVIPPDPSMPARNGDIDELILGGHLVYLRDKLEFLFEGMHVDHHDHVSDQRYETWGLYAQVGYQLNKFKPYYRFDYLDAGEGDPYYGSQVVDVTRHTVGVRWDFIAWAALKMEYQHIYQENLDNPNALYVQATFTY